MSRERFANPDSLLPLAEQKEKVRGIPVCLIIPPSPFLADERVFPSLGPLKIAASLAEENRGQSQNPVSVIDLSGVGKNYGEVIAGFAKNQPIKTYGISATSPQIPYAKEIAQTLKELDHTNKVILGGPHATLTLAAHLKNTGKETRGTAALKALLDNFDTIVAGDGENAIFYAIDPENNSPIIDASQRTSPFFIKRGTLEQHPLPARDFIDLESYRYYIYDGEKKYRATSVIGQLGCPFECGFCGGRNTDFLRLTRTRSVEHIVQEIALILEMSKHWKEPIRGIMFYDDELNVIPSVLESLCQQLINLQKEMGVEMRFRGFVKTELFTPEQANLMYEAGFRILLTGIESGSNKILEAMRKHTTREINTRFVQTAHNAGLSIKALMSLGHPGESPETINESIEWILNTLTKGDDVDWTIITQYPGSPYYEDSKFFPQANAWLYETPKGERLWSSNIDFLENPKFYKGISGEYQAYVWTDYLSPEQLVAMRDYAEKITREILGLPPIQGTTPDLQFEHSMGQFPPPTIFRSNI